MTPEDEIDWEQLSKRLTLYAWRRLKRVGMPDQELAQDIAFEAIRRYFDEEYLDWDPDSYPTRLEYFGSVINGIVRNRVRRAQRRNVEPADLTEPVMERRMPSPAPDPERCVVQTQWAEQVIAELRRQLDDDPHLLRLLELMLDGVERPAEQAEVLSVPVRDIYNANRRLKRYYAVVRAHFAPDASSAQG